VVEELIEVDVLCIGGGIAGLMSAIRASELGAKVVVVEKANVLRSGAGATGCDHFRCYIPEIHGSDMKPVIEEVRRSQVGETRTINFVRTWMEKAFDIVKLWDSWGIPMKYQGKYEFAGHAFPGRPLTALKYAGRNQKPILTKEARKRNIKVINRVMTFDLLHDGTIVGAIGVGTREDKVVIFQAKSIVLGTGTCVRLYPGPTPGWMFNRADPPSTTGDGRAMAYRAGAELVNIEIPHQWAGPKYFSRCGKGTWVGVIRDSEGKPVGPFVTKPDRRYGDAIADAYHSLFEDYRKSAKGPIYMDCKGISDTDYEYMVYWMRNEGNTALLNNLEEENINLKENAIEFMTYELTTRGGIYYNEKCETSLKGLYAAGDEYFGGVSCAATFGWIAGENAAKYAKQVEFPEIDRVKEQIEEKDKLLSEIRSREVGATWQEANVALEQVMYDYAGSTRSETLLRAGLSHLQRLKDKAYSTIMAQNQHELMHCLEVFNLLDIGELVFIAASERKETRGNCHRCDYPYANPLLDNKVLVCKKMNGKVVAEWREVEY